MFNLARTVPPLSVLPSITYTIFLEDVTISLNPSEFTSSICVNGDVGPVYNNPPVARGDSIYHLGSDPVTIDVLFKFHRFQYYHQ